MVYRQEVEDPSVHAPTERLVRIPDHVERAGGLRAAVAPWMIFFAVGVVVAVALFAYVLSRASGGDAVPSPGRDRSVGTDADLNGFRTQTVNVDGSVDVLALAISPTSLLQYHGAPVTADGVVVEQVFGSEAFSVSATTGTELVVYVPPRADATLASLVPGQEVTFVGTLMPVAPDVGFLVGPTAAPLAQADGVFLAAVPETIEVVTPTAA